MNVLVENGQLIQINKPVPLTKQRYAETFQLVHSLSHEYESMISAMVELLTGYDSGTFSLLDIGPAKGIFTRNFLLRAKAKPGFYAAFEPNADHFHYLHDNVRQFTDRLELSSESFTPETVLQPRWDIILMSHSIYWLQPARQHIKAAMKGLNESGILVMFVQLPSALHLLHHPFKAILPANASPLNQHYCTIDLMNDLKELGLHVEETLLPGYLDLTEIWGSEKDLLEFGCFMLSTELSQQPNAVQQKLLYCIRANTLQLKGKKLFNQPSSLVIIRQ
ncbi:methyltransferase domain-containing protein [Endozoicomonas lisbonensis]|uniref:SAM-dependent methyltransferase n=1 Tax=Endozoicomonas lisbonensis TaxID=3120522 RepID=A0ABV2SKA5_9GAMM